MLYCTVIRDAFGATREAHACTSSHIVDRRAGGTDSARAGIGSIIAIDADGFVPAAARSRIQPPADRKTRVAVPVSGQGALDRQYRELLRLHASVRRARGDVP